MVKTGPAIRRPRHGRRTAPVAALSAFLALALIVLVAPAAAVAKSGVVTVRTVKVGSPGNPSVAVVPFTDAIYQSCTDAPSSSAGCQTLGGVDYGYGIGELEITVKQWVTFLNRVDPKGRAPHDLYGPTEGGAVWPKYGQVNLKTGGRAGRHYSLADPAWADKPYGFASFLQAARFVNSLYNGSLRSKQASAEGAYRFVTYKVRLSKRSGRGMYDLVGQTRSGAERSHRRGFVVPSQDEWTKAAYYDPSGGGTYSYWKYPTNAGVFGDGTATAPSPTTLDPTTGDVTNATTQPLASYHASGLPAPSWCPAAVSPDDCSSVNPFGIDPTTYADLYQGSVGTVGQALTRSPWGTLDQGGNSVEWTDTITPPPAGSHDPRVWRRLHGGISNAPAYQLWLSAVGLQPEDNKFYDLTYPWLGFRVGVIGGLKPDRG